DSVTGVCAVPSMVKVTVPVGVPALLATVAVKVTDWPNTLGFADDDTVVVLAPMTLRVADAGPPGGTPVPITCEVVLVIEPVMVACSSWGTLQDAPAPRVTLFKAKPEPLKTAEPALQV